MVNFLPRSASQNTDRLSRPVSLTHRSTESSSRWKKPVEMTRVISSSSVGKRLFGGKAKGDDESLDEDSEIGIAFTNSFSLTPQDVSPPKTRSIEKLKSSKNGVAASKGSRYDERDDDYEDDFWNPFKLFENRDDDSVSYYSDEDEYSTSQYTEVTEFTETTGAERTNRPSEGHPSNDESGLLSAIFQTFTRDSGEESEEERDELTLHSQSDSFSEDGSDGDDTRGDGLGNGSTSYDSDDSSRASANGKHAKDEVPFEKTLEKVEESDLYKFSTRIKVRNDDTTAVADTAPTAADVTQSKKASQDCKANKSTKHRGRSLNKIIPMVAGASALKRLRSKSRGRSKKSNTEKADVSTVTKQASATSGLSDNYAQIALANARINKPNPVENTKNIGPSTDPSNEELPPTKKPATKARVNDREKELHLIEAQEAAQMKKAIKARDNDREKELHLIEAKERAQVKAKKKEAKLANMKAKKAKLEAKLATIAAETKAKKEQAVTERKEKKIAKITASRAKKAEAEARRAAILAEANAKMEQAARERNERHQAAKAATEEARMKKEAQSNMRKKQAEAAKAEAAKKNREASNMRKKQAEAAKAEVAKKNREAKEREEDFVAAAEALAVTAASSFHSAGEFIASEAVAAASRFYSAGETEDKDEGSSWWVFEETHTDIDEAPFDEPPPSLSRSRSLSRFFNHDKTKKSSSNDLAPKVLSTETRSRSLSTLIRPRSFFKKPRSKLKKDSTIDIEPTIEEDPWIAFPRESLLPELFPLPQAPLSQTFSPSQTTAQNRPSSKPSYSMQPMQIRHLSQVDSAPRRTSITADSDRSYSSYDDTARSEYEEEEDRTSDDSFDESCDENAGLVQQSSANETNAISYNLHPSALLPANNLGKQNAPKRSVSFQTKDDIFEDIHLEDDIDDLLNDGRDDISGITSSPPVNGNFHREREYNDAGHEAIEYTEFNTEPIMQVHQYKSPPKIRKSSGDVLVKVQASTVSYSDCVIRQGHWWGSKILHPPITPGVDFVGSICGIGEAAKAKFGFRRGDMVASLCRTGGNSRFAKVDAKELVEVPEGVSATSAVCMVETYLAAFQCLHLAESEDTRYEKNSLFGKTVLIIGGIAMVGQAMIDLAFLAGASTVYVTARKKHHEFIRSLGAIPLSMKVEDWMPVVKCRIDVIVDAYCTEHHSTISSALHPGGKMVCIRTKVSMLEENPGILWHADSLLSQFGISPLSQTYTYDVYESWEENLDLCKDDLAHLFEMLRRGIIEPPISDCIPLARVPQAQGIFQTKRVQGYFVCEPWLIQKKRTPAGFS